MAKANRSRARKTPKHVRALKAMHRQLVTGSMNVGAGSPIFEQIFHIGFEIEKGLTMCGVKLLADPKSPGGVMTGNLWPFGGGLEKPDQNEQRDSIRGDVREILERLGDVRDTGRILLQDLSAGKLDANALGGFIESSAEKIGRDLEDLLPSLGLKLSKDELHFLAA